MCDVCKHATVLKKLVIKVRKLAGRVKRFSELLRRYLAPLVLLTIVLGLAYGACCHDTASLFKPIVSVPLFFMLYPMMINIHIENIEREALSKGVILGVIFLNFILSPILAAIFANLFLANLNPYLVVGFVLKLTVPCSGMVIAWTGFAQGRTETALVIVSLSFLLGILLIPVWMYLLVGVLVPIDIWLMAQKIMIIIVLPLVAGLVTRRIIIRRWGMQKFKSIRPTFPAISSLGMFAIIFMMMALESQVILEHLEFILYIAIGILIIYPSLALIGILYSKLVGLDFEDGIAMTYGVTAKNHGITMAIAVTTFEGIAVLPAAFAPIIQIPLMLIILRLAPKLKTWINKTTITNETTGEASG